MRSVLLLLIMLSPQALAESLSVFVSVAPYKTFVEKVGGEHVAVQVLVRPGHDPHSYQPTPQQIAALSGAALYVRSGMPFEAAWMARIQAANPTIRLVDSSADGEPPALPAAHDHHGVAHGVAHGGLDPHRWTDPLQVRQIAASIRTALTELDPAHGADYARNFAAYALQIDALDRDIHTQLDGLPNRRFMVFHPAWGYFAARYGLQQIAIEQDGKQPGARALVALIEQARRERVRAIFVQPQFDRRAAEQVAAAIDGKVIAIDPLAADYSANMRRVAGQLAAALRP